MTHNSYIAIYQLLKINIIVRNKRNKKYRLKIDNAL